MFEQGDVVQQAVVLAGLIDPCQFLGQPLELNVGTADTGQLPLIGVDGLDVRTIVATHAGAVVVKVGFGPEGLARLLCMDVPRRPGIVVACRTYLLILESRDIGLVNVRFKPCSFVREEVQFEGCEIASRIHVQVGIVLQCCNHLLRTMQVASHFIEDV